MSFGNAQKHMVFVSWGKRKIDIYLFGGGRNCSFGGVLKIRCADLDVCWPKIPTGTLGGSCFLKKKNSCLGSHAGVICVVITRYMHLHITYIYTHICIYGSGSMLPSFLGSRLFDAFPESSHAESHGGAGNTSLSGHRSTRFEGGPYHDV